jgi:glycosyltransferase involved in cell wall biosynthesis
MSRLSHLAVDLTPLGPSGQNGGAGLVATSLVQELSTLDSDLRLTVLTAATSHDELSYLDADNVERLCVVAQPGVVPPPPRRFRAAVRGVLDRVPTSLRVAMANRYEQFHTARARASFLETLRPDLLFCPLTNPYFYAESIPMVSTVYDLQHLAYPEFFSPRQRAFRQQHLQHACAKSARVVAISDFVRQSILSAVRVRPERVQIIHLGLMDTPRKQSADTPVPPETGREPFLLYPANFWPHKNHQRLLEALRIHRRARPESTLRLVCTGAPNALMTELEATAKSILPASAVAFPGYLSRRELAERLRACRALVFPSLFEGFGMPIVEAMAAGKPVVCSNTTSLPEVAGDAAIYFDPFHPEHIASALAKLEDSPHLVAEMVDRGRARAARFGTARDVARRYLEVFEYVLHI